MHKTVAALLGALLSTALVIGVSPTTAAAAPATSITSTAGVGAEAKKSLVTRREFKRVRKGMTIQRVHRIFGAGGKQSYYSSGCCGGEVPAYQNREYRAGRFNFVSLTYTRYAGGPWRVDSKTAYWF